MNPRLPAGPLRAHPKNGRYFATPDGRALLLAGSHAWASVQDMGVAGQPPFDFEAFLDMAEGYGHNFTRLWHFEQPEGVGWSRDRVLVSPLPWNRVGEKFDLDSWNEAFFARLRERVLRAGERGFYVSVMLFQGWSLKKSGPVIPGPFAWHPLNSANNVQGIGAPTGIPDTDDAPTLHSLKNPDVLRYQEAYVRKTLETLRDCPHVLYEIINEGGALDWQAHFIRFIHEAEREFPFQHPVGFTHRVSPAMDNDVLLESEADWVSPAKEPQLWLYPDAAILQDYEGDPPASDGRKVVLLDTDHLWGIGGTADWAWRAVCRGHNPLFMDPWEPIAGEITYEDIEWFFDGEKRLLNDRNYPGFGELRAALGDARRYVERMNLVDCVPAEKLCSSRFCLAEESRRYLIFVPGGGNVTVDLRRAPGPLVVEWFDPLARTATQALDSVPGGDYRVLASPFSSDSVLFLEQASGFDGALLNA